MQKLQTLKGFRDFLPEEKKKRDYVINKIKKVFELYGFEPIETPAIEYTETLLGKYGSEADKLIYRFKDRGGRDVGLRYDLTVPLSRLIASNPSLPMPFKRYQIQPVWRADKPQAGRFREFLQCDVDIVGELSISADLEILSCLNQSLKALGFTDFTILVNSRKIFDQLGANQKIISILDKEDKIGKKEVLRLLNQEMDSDKKAQEFYLSLKNIKSEDYPNNLRKIIKKARNLNLFFSPFLARGLDYYTDLIFEVKIPEYKGGSVGGGGRYDNLIGIFIDKKIPAVGFSFGIDRLVEAMEQKNLLPKNIRATKALVTVFSPDLENKSIELANKLRLEKIATDLYLDAKDRLDKQLKYADKKGIPWVLIIGPDEVKEEKVTLKNMQSGTQETLSLEKAIEKLK